MNIAFFLALAVCSALLVLASFVQLLYVESLRLRGRDTDALKYFKEHFEERLALRLDRGALSYSLWKHSLIAIMGCFALSLMALGRQEAWYALAEAAALAVALTLLFAQIIPRLLYSKTEGHWLVAFLPVLRLMAIVVVPLIAILKFFQSLSELGQVEETEEEDKSDQIEALVAAGQEEGLIEEEDKKLIQSVVEFGDKRVREVMTPRPRIVGIEKNQTLDELKKLILHEQFSRIPVYDGSIDDVIGFVHVRDLFEKHSADPSLHVWKLMRPIRAIPESKLVGELLREMQADGAHMAVVIDEYGSTAGLATMEDLVEEIFGEIRDEHEPMHDVTPDGDGCWIVSGSYDLDHLSELAEFRAPEGTESTTVGGLAAEWLGRVPRPGESIAQNGLKLEILAANDRRVDRVRVSRSSPEEEGEA